MSVHRRGGDLVLGWRRTLRQQRPVAYQVRDRAFRGRPVPVGRGLPRLGFRVGAYDRALPLVIDPVLVYSSWFGGVGAEEFLDIALDANGFIYVLGVAPPRGYPTTPGAFQPSKPGSVSTTDYIVTKFNPAGTAVIYSTYLGGTGEDYASRSTCLAPWRWTRWGRSTWPARPSPRTSPSRPTLHALVRRRHVRRGVARLAADGSLGYGSYIGGTDTDQAFGVAVDAAGAAYVLGGTNSSLAEGFPVTGNAYSRYTDRLARRVRGAVSRAPAR